MRTVIQRVTRASISVNNHPVSKIGVGLLVLLGIEENDTMDDAKWLCSKIINLRVFNDTAGVMNLSVKEIDGEILLVSQFTLHALTKKGNRPSYIKAAKPVIAVPLYEYTIKELTKQLGKPISTGVFGADMKIELLNDGPVTIIIDSKNKE